MKAALAYHIVMNKRNQSRYLSRVISALTIFLVIYPILLSVPLSHIGSVFAGKNPYLLFSFFPVMLLLHFVLSNYLEFSWCMLFEKEYAPPKLSSMVNTFMYGCIFRKKSGANEEAKPRYLSFSMLRLVFGSVFLCFVGVTLLDAIVQISINQDLVAPVAINDASNFFSALLFLGIIFPIIETIIMVSFITILTRLFKLGPLIVIFISALGWAILHGVSNHPLQALSMFWMFFVLTAFYFRAKKYSGWAASFLGVYFTHFFNNFLALCFIAIKQMSLGF